MMFPNCYGSFYQISWLVLDSSVRQIRYGFFDSIYEFNLMARYMNFLVVYFMIFMVLFMNFVIKKRRLNIINFCSFLCSTFRGPIYKFCGVQLRGFFFWQFTNFNGSKYKNIYHYQFLGLLIYEWRFQKIRILSQKWKTIPFSLQLIIGSFTWVSSSMMF